MVQDKAKETQVGPDQEGSVLRTIRSDWNV